VPIVQKDVFREALRVCKPHLRDLAVAGYLAQAEQAMIRQAEAQVLFLCLTAARAAGEAEARARRVALDGAQGEAR